MRKFNKIIDQILTEGSSGDLNLEPRAVRNAIRKAYASFTEDEYKQAASAVNANIDIHKSIRHVLSWKALESMFDSSDLQDLNNDIRSGDDIFHATLLIDDYVIPNGIISKYTIDRMTTHIISEYRNI